MSEEEGSGQQVLVLTPRKTTEVVTQLLHSVQEMQRSISQNKDLLESQMRMSAQPQYYYVPQGISMDNLQGANGSAEKSGSTGSSTARALSKRQGDDSTEDEEPRLKKQKTSEEVLSLGDNLSDIDTRITSLLSPEKGQQQASLQGEESEGDSEFESILKQFSEEVNETEDKAAPVLDNLAKCMTGIWEKPLPKEKYLDKLKKHKVPQNVKLGLKRCNPEVWNNMLNARQKTFDLKLQKIQNALIKSNACIVSCVNDLMKVLKDNNGSEIPRRIVKMNMAIKKAMDASTLTAGVNAYTNKLRREALGNSSVLLKGIVSDQDNNNGELLFGDVTKRMVEYKTSLNTLNHRQSKNPKGYALGVHKTTKTNKWL